MRGLVRCCAECPRGIRPAIGEANVVNVEDVIPDRNVQAIHDVLSAA